MSEENVWIKKKDKWITKKDSNDTSSTSTWIQKKDKVEDTPTEWIKRKDNNIDTSGSSQWIKKKATVPVNMATGGLMSMPPYIAKQDEENQGITPYDVNTPMSARKGLPSRALDKSRTRFNTGDIATKEFPDLSGDGEVTQKDILIGKGVIKKAKGGIMQRLKYDKGELSTKEIIEMKKMEQLEAMQDSGLPLTAEQKQALESYKASKAIKSQELALGGMVGVERSKYDQRPDYQAYAEGDMVEDESLLTPMGMEEENAMAETDMEMEAEARAEDEDITDEDLEGMDAIIDTSALSDEEEKLLDEAVEMHPELEAIIPKLVATEFTDDGEVEGPGTGTSDSIPALLSDGEFVFTAKAVKNIGVDKLRKMMKQAEESYDAGIQSQADQQEIV